MRSHLLNLGLLTGLSIASMATFAEPPVQAGETLESLSKVKVTTTINGQPASLNELISSGQIKPIQAIDHSGAVAPSAPEIDPNRTAINPDTAADATATEAPVSQPAPATQENMTSSPDGLSEIQPLEPHMQQ